MRRRNRLSQCLFVVGLLAGALALDGLVPSPAWAPPPPPRRPRPLPPKKPLPPPLRPKVAPPVVPTAPSGLVFRLKNLRGHALTISLPGDRTLHIPPGGAVPIAGDSLSAPDVQAHIARGDVAVIRAKP